MLESLFNRINKFKEIVLYFIRILKVIFKKKLKNKKRNNKEV